MLLACRDRAIGCLLAVVCLLGFPASVAAADLILGSATVGTSTDTGDSNYLNGSRFTMPASGGTVSSMSVHVGNVSASPNNKYQVGIYTDNAGKPATLVASSSTGTLAPNSWNTLPLTARLQANTTYWLMYNTNGSSASVNNMHYGTGGSDAYSQGSIAFGSWPGSFGPATGGTLLFSIYATYTPDATSVDSTPPSAPGTLTATGGQGSAALAWGPATDNVGVVGYAVYRSTTSGFTPGLANRVAQPTGTTFTDTGLSAGTYFYVVTAQDAAGNVGAPSNQASAAVTAAGDPRSTVGEWASPVSVPIVMQHAVLLPNTSRVLFFESGSTARVLDPATGAVSQVPVAGNIYCAGHTILEDGRAITIGGDNETQNAGGIVDTYAFDGASNTWTRLADMAFKRWYPTATRLPNGRILALSGSSDGCTSCFVQTPEVFNPATNAWTTLSAAAANIPYYPFVYILPDGRLIQVGASEDVTPTRVLDLNAQAWSTVDARLIDGGSSSMYRPGRILKAGTASDGNTAVRPSSSSAYVIDMASTSPAWQPTGSMAFPRAFLNLTTLPDGNVLATGGETTADGTNVNNAVKAAEVWSPSSGLWSTLASSARPRLYHSVALLLPDGRVLVGGSGNDGPVPVELNYEIFSPPYLFKGTRPAITSAPGVVGFGQAFSVTSPDAGRIASVALVAPAAVTHAFDMNARFVPLSFSATTGALQIQAPASSNLAPPGYYMLFLVDTSGVPSVATWLRVTAGAPDTTPPSAPGTLGASGAAGSASLTWGPATDNVGVTGYNVYRATTSGFVVGPGNLVGQVASTTFNDTGLAAGTYYYRVTASDAAGNTGPASNEASAVVTQGTSAVILERTVFADVVGTATVTGVSSNAPGGLVVAFVSADGPGNLPQAATVSGGGLTWTLVRRSNSQSGTAEIWQAPAPAQLVNATFQSVLVQGGYHQSMTVAVLNGASGVGATAGGSAASGAPSVQLTATAAGSWVFGVGNDYDSATARTLGQNQTIVHQWLETSLGDTYWVQRLSSPVASAGSVITINDTAPTNDRWNFSAVEVVPR